MVRKLMAGRLLLMKLNRGKVNFLRYISLSIDYV
ncbi:hypothetical protein Salpa_4380 [Sporomusa sp. KB1]|jgi:hypothetical protein|nr:hypothetical protein Salpa_4380 [Sporomusa sp. KB1]